MSIVLDDLVKSYDEHLVVNRVSLEVADGECFVLLGPSGSGKSTVLRIVAGLVDADGGRVRLHGRDVTDLSARRRGVGMVFQNYALFGHMTVADNVEFALRVRKVGRRERARRRDELLELVGLVGFHKRFPHQLSGGQQQRVAIARALAHRPEVLLLDEPFGALDALIRAELRRTLRAIQRELKVTAIFVTHDQDEAFELGDRVGVMHDGRLLEVGTPDELYLRPETEFVATFLGKANLFVGECSADGIRIGDAHFPLDSRAAVETAALRVQVLFRPEDVAVKREREALDGPTLGEGQVEDAEFSGSIERLRIRIPAQAGVRPIAPVVPFGADYLLLDAARPQHLARRFPLAVGDPAWVGIRRLHALAHRGLRFGAVAVEGSAAGAYARDLAERCRARLRIVPASGIGKELAREPVDLAIVPRDGLDGALHLETLFDAGAHHVLVVPEATSPVRSVLLGTAAGEAAKEDVVAAARVLRHLASAVTLLTVLAEDDDGLGEQVARFHDAAVRTLSLYAITASGVVRSGDPHEVLLDEVRRTGSDLLVIGSPPPTREGAPVGRLVERLAREAPVPLLIVRATRPAA